MARCQGPLDEFYNDAIATLTRLDDMLRFFTLKWSLAQTKMLVRIGRR